MDVTGWFRRLLGPKTIPGPQTVIAELPRSRLSPTGGDAKLHDFRAVVADLASGSPNVRMPMLRLIAERIDEQESVFSKEGIEYSRYVLWGFWRLSTPKVAAAIWPLVTVSDSDLRACALSLVGRVGTLNRRNGAAVLVTAGESMRRYARDHSPLYGEDVGIAAHDLGAAAILGGRFEGNRSILVAASHALPDPVAEALFCVEDKPPTEAIATLLPLLDGPTREARAAADSLGLLFQCYPDAALAEIEALKQRACKSSSPGQRTAADIVLEALADVKSRIKLMGAQSVLLDVDLTSWEKKG